TAIAEQMPIRVRGANVGAGATFESAVVPFPQVSLDVRDRAEASQLARANRALQGAREHRGERQSREPLSELDGLGFAPSGQREVSQYGVLVRHRPGGCGVSRLVSDR